MKKLIIFLYILTSAGVALSAVTGSISGKVIEEPGGAILQAVNIIVEGTVRGASTNMQGEYIIDRLPPGTYSLRASIIGFRNETRKDITVRANQTTKVNFELQATTLEFDPIVVLAGKTEQRLDEASVSMSVVTSREIERRNATSIIEALETAPGINFIGDQINIRGSTGFTFGAGNKTLLLLDGVPVYASDTGAFNWDMLPPLDIEQIEVLKGAGSTLWGSSALGGVVNIITKDPTPEGAVLFSYTAGQYGHPRYDQWQWTDPDRLHYTREDVSLSKRMGPVGLRISAGRFMSTGYTELGDFQKQNLTGKVDYRFKNGIKWTGYAAYSRIKKGFFVQWLGPNDPYQVDPPNLKNRSKVNQISLYTKLAIPFNARFAVNVRMSMNRSLLGNQFGNSTDFDPALGQGGEIQATYIPVYGHVITFGTQYQDDSGSIPQLDSLDKKITVHHQGTFLGPYIQDEWSIKDRIKLTLGIRYDRYKLYNGGKEDLFSPRFGINVETTENSNFRFSVGSGFRAATITERFLEMTVMNFKIKDNPDLKSESSWAYDIGWRVYPHENWLLDISAFYNDYNELIEAHLDLIRGQIQFRNIPRARIQGIEFLTKISQPVHVFGMHMTPGLEGSFTYMHHEELEYGEPLPYRPDWLATVKSTLRFYKHYNLQVDYRYASKIAEVKIYPINERVPMHFVDARLDIDWRMLILQLGVTNLLNYNYAPRESNLMPMRTYTVGLRGSL